MKRVPVVVDKCMLGYVESSEAPDAHDRFEENTLFGMHAVGECFQRSIRMTQPLEPQERFLLVVRAIAEAQAGRRDESLEGAISVLFIRHYGTTHLDRMMGLDKRVTTAAHS